MSRPDDLDRAEARAAAARARLHDSTGALQTQLQPRALARTLVDGAAQRRLALIGATAAVAGAATLIFGLLRRRRTKRSRAQPTSEPSVRSGKRNSR